MLKVFIQGTDYSSHLEDGSLTIQDQIQNKANVANFNLLESASAPSENQEVKFYDTVKLVSASGTEIIVEDTLASGLSILPDEEVEVDNALYGMTRGKFRAGQAFWLDIGGADEEKIIIDTIEEDSTAGQVKITATESIVNSHSANEDCGKLIFGGTLTSILQKNKKQLTDVWYQCSATDYTKIFDKKLVNDSWESVDARYIINDFFNTTINYVKTIDSLDYDNNTAIQAEWIDEANDADNPTVDSSDFIEGDAAGVFNWSVLTGTATWRATPTSSDISAWTGASSGTPSSGKLMIWLKPADYTKILTIKVRLGSSNSDYAEFDFDVPQNDEWNYATSDFVNASITGTPDWTAVDYIQLRVTETADSSLSVNGIRVLEDTAFTLYNVEETSVFDDARASFKKPTVFVERLAKTLGYYWYIDYERDLHFFDRETNEAPFSISDSSDNFDKLVVDVDTSQLKNRQTVRGGTKTSDSLYTQVVEGDGAVREWIMKAQFENLTIALDDNTTTDLTESGTTTTNITIVGHSLSDGDYIVNRTRSNAVRKITYVDADNFTVEAVSGQTTGDTLSFFATSKDVGVENLVDETTVDYVSNFNEKSIRATESEDTLESGEFLLFSYNEIVPIRVQEVNTASIASMKAILGGDGIFDGAVITDQTLDSTQAVRDRARAEVDAYSNPIVTVTFKTDFEGLESGQIVSVSDTNKGINDNYVIQKVKIKYQVGDYPVFDVTAASTLFGLIEYFQKLSDSINDRLIDEDEIIDQIVSENVTMTLTPSDTVNTPAHSASETPTLTLTPSDTATERDMTTDPYTWQPDTNDARWGLAQWG